ncbi:Nn.00g009010.m01.CDS01 [Neocucurbitaria sp. VM-36]
MSLSRISDARPLRRSMFDGPSFDSKPITIVVGAAGKKFFVHESQIRSSSEFFDNAMNHDMGEKFARTITLPELDPKAFEIYIKWLYSGQFFITEDEDDDDDDDDDEEEDTNSHDDYLHDAEWDRWSNSYQLGDFLGDEDFRDALMDMAIEKMRDETYYIDLPNSIYSYSSAASPHRQVALDAALYLWPHAEFKMAVKRSHHAEFLTDFLGVVGSKIRIGVEERSTFELFSPDINTCRYHEHILRGAPCYKDKGRFLL